jgi:hypothetical protein
MRSVKVFYHLLCLGVVLALAAGVVHAQSITVPAPAAGVTWYKGQTYNITWTSIDGVPDQVVIRLRDSTSTKVIQKIADNIPTGAGSYSWTIPNTVEPGNYVVRVRAGEVIGDSVVFSIAPFMVAPFRPERWPSFRKASNLKSASPTERRSDPRQSGYSCLDQKHRRL